MDGERFLDALGRFRDALPACLAKLAASAEFPEPVRWNQQAMRVTVRSRLDWQKTDEAMVGFAAHCGLPATHVRTGLVSAAAPAPPERFAPFVPLVQTARKRLGVLLQPNTTRDSARRRLTLA
jgi:hypothetical protein